MPRQEAAAQREVQQLVYSRCELREQKLETMMAGIRMRRAKKNVQMDDRSVTAVSSRLHVPWAELR
jgi:hypothetical protein